MELINAGKNGRNGMQEYRMVLLQDGKNQEQPAEGKDALLEESQKVIQSMFEDKDVRLVVRLEQDETGRELVLVLDKPDEEAMLKARLQKIPAVKSGIWKARVIPVFFGKGTLNQS